MSAYSVSKGDYLLVGEYDPDELAGLLEERDLRILRRYVATMLSTEGRVVVQMPGKVYETAPDTVQQVLGELLIVTPEWWGSVIGNYQQVEAATIDLLIGSDSGEEWTR